jgi:hypothetical protein
MAIWSMHYLSLQKLSKTDKKTNTLQIKENFRIDKVLMSNGPVSQ